MTDRVCECGCEKPLEGKRSQRFATEACRARAHRAELARGRAAGATAPVGLAPPPLNGDRQVSRGLENWLRGRDDLPEVLVEGARVLAAQLDLSPRNSPLWGRYTTLLRLLTEPEREERAWHVEQRQLVEQIALAGHDERWRASKYAEAKAAGMDPIGWTKVVPVSCVWGQHQWKRSDYWKTVRCKWCDEIQPRGNSE
jgi:hypothetical protein